MKKAKECPVPIFGLLKIIKMLERCEVCPSWPTEKAYKYRTKAKSSEKPTLKEKADNWTGVSQKYKISQSNISMQKPHS